MNQHIPIAKPSLSNEAIQSLPLVVGVDLGGTQIRTAVLRGTELLSRVAVLTGENTAPEHIIPRLYDAVEQALEDARVTLAQIVGMGIGAPGPLDSRTGIVFAPPNLPGWDRVPLRRLFEEHFSLADKGATPSPGQKMGIFVENDANAAALGEYMFGAGRGCRNIVYLTISTGIGGGVIVDGKIMEGASGTAGELGHMTIDWQGERCTCGNVGCLEYLASGTAIARQADEAVARGEGADVLAFVDALRQHDRASDQIVPRPLHDSAEPEHVHISARTLSQAAQAGIPLARAIITGAAEALGVGLVNIVHIFNPEVIILGGGVTQMGAMLMEPALRIVQERAMKVPGDAVRIVLAELGTDVGLVGAGALVYHSM